MWKETKFFNVARYNAHRNKWNRRPARRRQRRELLRRNKIMPKKVRCTFELDEKEAKKLCDMRCEPKPSTAAAQVVRQAIKEGSK